ncbi:MAG TPA: DUF1294 domain-containing protein [Noviherbaspirillum sp.]|nr:DUF1294 domain-containing protein [Noviherbaspirillum sp.]
MPASFAALFLTALIAATLAGAISSVVFAVYATASATAFVAYGLDKAAARGNRRRTRESTLHVFGLAGGWPGALLAQAAFRHKTSKQSFQAVFWTTVFLNVAGLAAFLYLRGWQP